MSLFNFIFQSRGASNVVKRTWQVCSRFGPRPERMGKRFDRFMDLLDRYNCRPTFPITALPMSRHPGSARRLLSRGAELAVHSYAHVDLTALDREEQSEHIGKAIQLFRSLGVPFAGFRAPYLHWNEDTMSVLEAYQFRYSSNQTVLWNVVDLESLRPEQLTGWEKAKDFYQPLDAAQTPLLPYRRNGFIEIPVSLPDDETLIDRMYLKDPKWLSNAWREVLEQTHTRGELFTLQLHPERVDWFAEPLSDILSSCRGRKLGIWIAALEEIAEWWTAKVRNSAEFVREDGGYKVVLKACRGAVVYYRLNGIERTLEPGVIKVEGPYRPCVGISPGSERSTIEKLEERGYILEVGEPAEDYSIHLGKVEHSGFDAIQELLKRLDECEGPLVRFGTWPYGNQSAVAVTGDIDALTIWDFINRLRGA